MQGNIQKKYIQIYHCVVLNRRISETNSDNCIIQINSALKSKDNSSENTSKEIIFSSTTNPVISTFQVDQTTEELNLFD